GRVCIEASDTGQGMAPDVLARCMEPFFTTKPAGAGTGLGLAVARQLVESAGGRLAVASSRGQGTTFRIALPLPAAAPAARPARRLSRTGVPPRPRRGSGRTGA